MRLKIKDSFINRMANELIWSIEQYNDLSSANKKITLEEVFKSAKEKVDAGKPPHRTITRS